MTISISKTTYRKLRSRDYFPIFLYEFYKQNLYNPISIENNNHYSKYTDIPYFIDYSIRWDETSGGDEYWQDIYSNEIKYKYDNIKKDV